MESQADILAAEPFPDVAHAISLIDSLSWRTNVSNTVQQNLRDTLNDLNDNQDKMYVKSDKGDKPLQKKFLMLSKRGLGEEGQSRV